MNIRKKMGLLISINCFISVIWAIFELIPDPGPILPNEIKSIKLRNSNWFNCNSSEWETGSTRCDEGIKRLLQKVVVVKSNPHYRAGDVIFQRGYRWNDSMQHILHDPEFKDSILRKYLLANGGNNQVNLKLLKEITFNHSKEYSYDVPLEQEIVIHIRAGDVVEHPWFLKAPFKQQINQIILNHRLYNYSNFKAEKYISIVTAFSFQEFLSRGWWLFSEEKLKANLELFFPFLKNLLRAFPHFLFQIVSNNETDRDIAYCVLSKHFIPDEGGGFSRLLLDTSRS